MRTTLLFLIVFTLFITLQAQNKVEITEITPFHYVYMEFKGYSRFEDFNKYLPQLMQEIKNQGLSSSIRGNLLAVFFETPFQKSKGDFVLSTIVWRLCFQISEEISVKPPLKKGQYNYKKVAKTTHIGTLGMIYNFIVPYIEEENLEIIGPQLLKIIDKPTRDRPDLLRGVFLVPVRKRNKSS